MTVLLENECSLSSERIRIRIIKFSKCTFHFLSDFFLFSDIKQETS